MGTIGNGSAQPLNILILMGDQHRWDALGCAADGLEPSERTWLMGGPNGAPLVRTPHLDGLAAEGMRFPQAVANFPLCVPSRHSFITGLYPHQLGILGNRHYWPHQPPVPTLGMHLKAAGYATAAVGKMHWKFRTAPDEHVPDKRGFDFRASGYKHSDGPWDVNHEDVVTKEERALDEVWVRRWGTGGQTRLGYIGDVSPLPGSRLREAWLADQAVAYLRRRRESVPATPFCLLVSLDRPHVPNVIPADYDGLYDPERMPLPPPVPAGFVEDDDYVRRDTVKRELDQMDERELRLSVSRYLANVTYVDACLGRVLDALRACGYENNTLVVLLSDHGDLLGERARAHGKPALYDAALRVPLIVRWPGAGPRGAVSHAAVELIDLMPTWLEAAGIDVPDYLPGRSLQPLLEGRLAEAGAGEAGGGWRANAFAETYHAEPGAREVGSRGAEEPAGAQWALRGRRFKLIERQGGRSALYDLRADPAELHNRIDDPALADVREGLRTDLLHRMMRCAAQFPAGDGDLVSFAPPKAFSANAKCQGPIAKGRSCGYGLGLSRDQRGGGECDG